MRSSRRARPVVLTLEGRSLLSGATSAAPAAAHSHVGHASAYGPNVVLNGHSTDLVVVNKYGIAHVTGKGHLSGLGAVTVTSTVNSKSGTPLLSDPAMLYANLQVAAARGVVNVHVTPGTIGINPFAQPFHMQYSIAGGTGAYRHAAGKGLVDLSLFQAVPTTLGALKQMGTQVDTVGVPFALHFHPGHLNRFGDFSSMWFGVIKGLEHKSGASSRSHGHARPH